MRDCGPRRWPGERVRRTRWGLSALSALSAELSHPDLECVGSKFKNSFRIWAPPPGPGGLVPCAGAAPHAIPGRDPRDRGARVRSPTRRPVGSGRSRPLVSRVDLDACRTLARYAHEILWLPPCARGSTHGVHCVETPWGSNGVQLYLSVVKPSPSPRSNSCAAGAAPPGTSGVSAAALGSPPRRGSRQSYRG